MKVVAFAGYSGAGKTTLLEQLIPALKALGLRVSVVKHAHHRFDIDQPGKDSFRHRKAGAYEVLIASDHRLALMREFEAPTQLSVHALIAELDPAIDWVLVEGFKFSELFKVEIWRAAAGQPARYPEDDQVVAIATDTPELLPAATLREVLDLNDAPAMAEWLVANQDLFEYRLHKLP
jgi:molybdopterin-guanine dinucleotide biosynthesis protein B